MKRTLNIYERAQEEALIRDYFDDRRQARAIHRSMRLRRVFIGVSTQGHAVHVYRNMGETLYTVTAPYETILTTDKPAMGWEEEVQIRRKS